MCLVPISNSQVKTFVFLFCSSFCCDSSTRGTSHDPFLDTINKSKPLSMTGVPNRF